MLLKRLTSSAGFTYLAALMLIMLSGIMLGLAGRTWQQIMQREREEELLFRGKQIHTAIARWNKYPTQLNDLKDLLKDPRTAATHKYLRRSYKDPMTGEDWALIKDPIYGIIGVASTSNDAPIKQANFPDEFKDFEGKTKYSDWKFVVQQTDIQQARNRHQAQ